MSQYDPQFCINCQCNVIEGDMCEECAKFLRPAEPIKSVAESIIEAALAPKETVVVEAPKKAKKVAKKK